MKPIGSDQLESKPADLILRSRAKHGVSKDRRRHHVACGRPSSRAPQSALLRMRLIGDIDVIRTSETRY
jgi:hypothetical protein